MADFSKFRTAVSGFNRTDVVNYIEAASAEHQKALRKLTDERDKLAADNAALQAQLDGAAAPETDGALQEKLEQVQQELEQARQELEKTKQERDSLAAEVDALAQEGVSLADQLKQAQQELEQARQEPAEQPETEQPQEPSLQSKELSAYRLAAQTERNAVIRARRIYGQLSNLCEDARSRYLESGEEIAALTADLQTGLGRLQDAFAEVQVIFDDAQNAFDQMELPEADGAAQDEE